MKTADARALNNLIGVRIGKFDVIAEIGTGGMATVYLARSVGGGGFHRLVAIKVMHRHLSSEDGFVEMFLDEARVAATIHHPNIVSILDVGLEDGLIFLVMDYVEGDSFSAIEKIAVNQRKRIPLGVILRVALDSLAGLHAAHELCDIHGQHLKIVHRDVSPHNIVTGVDGISRIVDFGIAKAETRITTTKVGMIKGKLNFMAPEQIRNTPLDRRVDIFGMGVTLWEAVTLRRLYAGENDFDTARKILAGEYPPLTQFDPTLPPALDDICRKALHPNPDERFRTAEEFAVAIERNLRDYIAPHREVGAFIATVAAPKIERERRALRESIAGPPAAPDLEIDETDDPEFMSSTMVDADFSETAPAVAPVPLPSTATPRNHASDSAPPARSKFRASTMAMPVRGGPTKSSTPPPGVRDRRPSVQVPMPDAVMRPKTPIPRPDDPYGVYDDDGLTSPLSIHNAASIASGVRGVPRPVEEPRDDVEFAEARTVFKAPANVPAAFEEALAHPRGANELNPEASDTAPKPGRTLAIDLVQVRAQSHDAQGRPASGSPPSTSPSYPPASPSHPPTSPSHPGFASASTSGQLPAYPAASQGPSYTPESAPDDLRVPEEGGAMRAALYILLSIVLVGGASGVLWYVLHQH